MLKHILAQLKAWKSVLPLHLEWWRARSIARTQGESKRDSSPCVLIVPGDPWTLVGSKGDEAMIQAVLDQVSSDFPGAQFGALTCSEAASKAATALGITPVQAWDGSLNNCVDSILKFGANVVIIVGADCMDGYYSPYTTTKMIAIGDLCARAGCVVMTTGFSFNDAPASCLAFAYARVHGDVIFNVRDPISIARFKAFCGANARLVADAAFMLRPRVTERTLPVTEWVSGKKRTGAFLVGFNVHPMLIKNASNDEISRLVGIVAADLEKALVADPRLCCAFIAHDFRAEDGDDRCLGPVFDQLTAKFGDRLFYERQGVFSAGELKQIAGQMDLVVTGRMHLSIASLGMGVPVAVITYQDKFQGLLSHFGITQRVHASPQEILEVRALPELVSKSVAMAEELRQQVAVRLPEVKRLSQDNLRGIHSRSGGEETRERLGA